MGRAALDLVADYYETLAARAVLRPTTSAHLRRQLDEPAPATGLPFADLLDTVREVVEQYARHAGHPRCFGYVSSPGTPVAAMGSMIAAALTINVTCWRSGTAAAEMELLCIRWIKEMLGYPADGAGLLVSGGSMANFAGIAAAPWLAAHGVALTGPIHLALEMPAFAAPAKGQWLPMAEFHEQIGVGENSHCQSSITGDCRSPNSLGSLGTTTRHGFLLFSGGTSMAQGRPWLVSVTRAPAWTFFTRSQSSLRALPMGSASLGSFSALRW